MLVGSVLSSIRLHLELNMLRKLHKVRNLLLQFIISIMTLFLTGTMSSCYDSSKVKF